MDLPGGILSASGWVAVGITLTTLIIKNRRSKRRDFRSLVEKFRDDVNGWYNQIQSVAAKLETSLPGWTLDKVHGYLEALKLVQGRMEFMPYCDGFYEALSQYRKDFPAVSKELAQLGRLYERFRFSVLKYKEEVDLTKIIHEQLEPSEILFVGDILRLGPGENALAQIRQQMQEIARLRQMIFDLATNVAASLR